MQHYAKIASLSIICLSTGAGAFVAPSRMVMSNTPMFGAKRSPQYSRLYTAAEDEAQDDEIARLKSMAAKLRAEAAALEAEKAKELALVAEKAFLKFDTDQDGVVNTADLKTGLEKVLKTDLSESRVKELMKEFDKSGDGVLQLDEFVGVDQFRNRLEALAREEKRIAQDAAKQAKIEQEVAAALEMRLGLLNDRPPTTTDKLVSVLPYLFPLLDGLMFGRFLLQGDNNPVIDVIFSLYLLYRSVPFSGFILFFALSFLSNNPSLNRLVRFNMQQAIFFDIALFFPGLIAAIVTLFLSGVEIPPGITELGSDAIFVTLIAAIGYSVVSSLLGITPDKIPIISQAALDRMPTLDWFDDQGRFIPRGSRGKKEEEDEKKDKKDD